MGQRGGAGRAGPREGRWQKGGDTRGAGGRLQGGEGRRRERVSTQGGLPASRGAERGGGAAAVSGQMSGEGGWRGGAWQRQARGTTLAG